MEQKYVLTQNSKVLPDGTEVFQIISTKEIPGVVDQGVFGGYVSNELILSQSGKCWIDDNCIVYGDSRVTDNASVMDGSILYNTVVRNEAVVGHSYLDGACIDGNADVMHIIHSGELSLSDFAIVITESFHKTITIPTLLLPLERRMELTIYNASTPHTEGTKKDVFISHVVKTRNVSKSLYDAISEIKGHGTLFGRMIDDKTIEEFTKVASDMTWLLLNKSLTDYMEDHVNLYDAVRENVHSKEERKDGTNVEAVVKKFNDAMRAASEKIAESIRAATQSIQLANISTPNVKYGPTPSEIHFEPIDDYCIDDIPDTIIGHEEKMKSEIIDKEYKVNEE